MSCKKKKKDSSTCVPSSRRLLATMVIKDLAKDAASCSCPKQFGPGTSGSAPCKCDEDDCSPGRCCFLDRQCESSSRPPQQKDIEPCEPACNVAQLENMIEEIQSYRDLFRKLTVEAKNVLEPRCSQIDSDPCCTPPNERAKAQTEQQSCSKEGMDLRPCKTANPKVQKSHSVCAKIGSDTAMPCIPQKTLSKNCSLPIAQEACKVTEGRICKMQSDEEEKRLRKKSSSKTGFENKPADEKKIGKNFFKKLIGKKPSECSCDDETLKQNKENEKIVNMANTKNNAETKSMKGKKLLKKVCCPTRSDCDCKVSMNDLKVGKNKDGKVVNKTNDCFCDTKEDEGCPCRFPLAYCQYFKCTGEVAGNCHCRDQTNSNKI